MGQVGEMHARMHGDREEGEMVQGKCSASECVSE